MDGISKKNVTNHVTFNYWKVNFSDSLEKKAKNVCTFRPHWVVANNNTKEAAK